MVFEATIGRNNLGDMAVDDVTIRKGSCPSNIDIN